MRAPLYPLIGHAVAMAILVMAGIVEPSQAARRSHHRPHVPPAPPPVVVEGPKIHHPLPLTIRDSEVVPVEWTEVEGWAADDHGAAFATFRDSCRPIARNGNPPRETRPMYPALHEVCRRAVQGPVLKADAARAFFEKNFRPVRIAKLGDGAGFLTGYYEPIVEGSRFPTQVFNTPIYRRPPDLVPPNGAKGAGFPNTGQSMRRTATGELVPYYDRGQIEDGALDGQHLEICWVKSPTEVLFIQIQGSARVRLEDGTLLRINYDAHNGYSYVPVGRVLIERGIVPREEMSMQRIADWMRGNPEGAKEVRRQNRSYVFFRIVGLNDDREAIGAQGIPLTAGRSIAVDRALHVYGTPFFINANLPIQSAKADTPFRRTMIAQDTGSAIVGPARADLYWGAGDLSGKIAGRIKQAGHFTMFVPRDLDPVEAGKLMPLPPPRPPAPEPAAAKTKDSKSKDKSKGKGKADSGS